MNTNNTIINGKTKFLRCKNGVAYYALTVLYSEGLYSFPVPLHGMQNEVLVAESHAIHFTDYIRKAIHDGTLIKEAA